MKRYSVEEIRKWLSFFGSPEYLNFHLSEENLDKFSPINKGEPSDEMIYERTGDYPGAMDSIGWLGRD